MHRSIYTAEQARPQLLHCIIHTHTHTHTHIHTHTHTNTHTHIHTHSHTCAHAQGLVNPVLPGSEGKGFKAFVFAVYDAQMKVQYTGFSNDLRNSLRTLMGRRPDKAHYFKCVCVCVRFLPRSLGLAKISWCELCAYWFNQDQLSAIL
jgi:hypothetical protein